MGFRGIVVLLLALLPLISCSGGAAVPAAQHPLFDTFRLTIWQESQMAGAQSFDKWVYESNNQVSVDIMVTGAVNLTSLYFSLSYDPSEVVPVGVEWSDLLAPQADRTEQSDLTSSGQIIAGEEITLLGTRGYSGDGRLARIYFDRAR